MTPAGEPLKAANWARVSTLVQHEENQLDVTRGWASRRSLEIVQEFVIEDSAWQKGNGTKGKQFDRERERLIEGARLGHYKVVLVWAVDRLSRRGIEDTLATMRRLYEYGCDIWSYQEPWLVTSEPRMRELLVSFMAWMAEQESARRSERIQAGMARVKKEIAAEVAAGKEPSKHLGGRKAGSRNRKRLANTAGVSAAWQPGGPLYEARKAKLAAERSALLADPVRLRESGRDVPCPPAPEGCGAAVGDVCRVVAGPNAGKHLRKPGGHSARQKAHRGGVPVQEDQQREGEVQ
jgi:putative DNA-invertase from lambdoid prophage Rac